MASLDEKIAVEGLTFDDVLLVPAYSEVLPREVNLQTRFSRNILLNIPVVSAAMDTVTEAPMAIALAREGGIGVIHKNMSVAEQAAEVRKVKRAENGMIDDPVTIRDTETDRKHVRAVLQQYKVEKLPVVNAEGKIVGLITYKDITKEKLHPNACKDARGRLRVAAGIGITPDAIDRVRALVAEGVDAVVLDSAHGHSKGVLDKLREIKAAFPNLDVVVGNVATPEAARDLVAAGADGVKVGIGPGSICTTRIVAGVGVPQLTAICGCADAIKGSGVPVIADGGLRYSGDVVKALAAGGDCVMCGSMFAGTEEAPGETIIYNGRKFKTYRGMGSIDAMNAGSKDRYFQDKETEAKKLVPEGIVGRVPFKGTLEETVYQLLGGIRSGMGYCGAKDIPALQQARFVRITGNGVIENHPRDVTITKETPNYTRGD